jgi:hypothetical protein
LLERRTQRGAVTDDPALGPFARSCDGLAPDYGVSVLRPAILRLRDELTVHTGPLTTSN